MFRLHDDQIIVPLHDTVASQSYDICPVHWKACCDGEEKLFVYKNYYLKSQVAVILEERKYIVKTIESYAFKFHVEWVLNIGRGSMLPEYEYRKKV